MSALVKTGLGLGAIGGIGGVSYGIYSTMQSTPEKPKSYAQELVGTLLSVNAKENETEWGKRLESLKKVKTNTELVSDLLEIKEKDTTAKWTELRDWCKDIINKENKGKEDKEFKNIESYCTFSVSEKLTNLIPEGTEKNDEKWKKGHDAIGNIAENDLVEELKQAKSKSGEEAKNAIHKWCTETYKKPYKGANDKDFKNAEIVCLSRD